MLSKVEIPGLGYVALTQNPAKSWDVQDKILAVDLSTKTGWALFSPSGELLCFGKLALPDVTEGYGPYPHGPILAAKDMIRMIESLVAYLKPTVVVVETVNNGRNRFTQQILNFLHYRLIEFCQENKTDIKYVDSMAWRKALQLKMDKVQKKNNAKLSKAKREAKKVGKILDKKALGIRGKVTVKHLSVQHVNEKFGLELKVKDNDMADAISLGSAYIAGAAICTGI